MAATIFNDSFQGVRLLQSAVDLLTKDLKDLTKESKKVVKALKFETSEDFKNLDKQIKLVSTAEKELIRIEKEDVKLKKELVNLEKAQSQALQAKTRTTIQATKEEERQIKIAKRLKTEKEKLTSIYARESARLNTLRKRYKDLALSENGASSATKKLKNEIQALDRRLKQADADVGQFQRSVGDYKQALAGSLGTIGQFATGAGAIAAGVLLAGKALSAGIDIIKGFEQANANLQAVLGVTRDEMGSLIKQAKALGASTSFSASEVTGLQTEFAKLGFPTRDIQLMTASTLDAANAMGADLGEQAKLTGATLKAFGLDASEAQRVNDVLSKATSASALDFQKLSTSMSTIAPVAASFGFSLEGTTALLGQLANAGFDASSAATATRNILLNLADANGKLAKSLGRPVKDLPSLVKGLKELEKKGIDLGEALELTDKRSVAAFSTFLKGTDSVLALNKTLEEAGGTAERMADIQLDTLEGSLKILNSSFEGLVLSIGDSTDATAGMTFVVQGLANLLSFLSGETKELVKSQSELNDENLKILKSTRASADENEKLADRYEELTTKVELNADERSELNGIIDDLIRKFGDSVAVINEETGALEINIDAVRKKILADKVLSTEAGQKLLVEKSRLEVQLRLAKDAERRFDKLDEKFTGFFAKDLIKAARKGSLELTQAMLKVNIELDNINDGTSFGKKQFEEFRNELEVLTPELIRLSTAVFSQGLNQIELNKINADFLIIGVDIDELLTKETSSITKGTGAKKRNAKATRELTGLIEKQAKAVRDLQQEKERVTKETGGEAEIARLTVKIETAQKELKRLQDLGAAAKKETTDGAAKAEFDLAVFRKEQAVQEEKDFETRIQREIALVNFKAEELLKFAELEDEKTLIIEQAIADRNAIAKRGDEERAEIAAKIAAAELEVRKKQAQRVNAIVREVAKLQKEKFKERQNQLNDEIKGSEDQQKRLQELADRGSETAKENLASERKREAELRLQKQQEQKKQEQTELLFKGLDVFSANLAQGQNAGQAAANTITTITLLGQALRGINFFAKEGLDDTGTVANPLDSSGGRIGILHDHEAVYSEKDRAQMDYATRAQVIDNFQLAESYKRGELVQAEQHKINTLQGNYLSNDRVLEEIEKSNEILKDMSNNMSSQGLTVDIVKGIMTFSESKNGKKTNTHFKINNRRSWA